MIEEGNIEKPKFGEYIVACVVCCEQKPVLLYPHRTNNLITGWVFVCAEHQEMVQSATVNIEVAKNASA